MKYTLITLFILKSQIFPSSSFLQQKYYFLHNIKFKKIKSVKNKIDKAKKLFILKEYSYAKTILVTVLASSYMLSSNHLSEIHYLLGRIYEIFGIFSRSIRHYRFTIKQPPKKTFIYSFGDSLGEIYLRFLSQTLHLASKTTETFLLEKLFLLKYLPIQASKKKETWFQAIKLLQHKQTNNQNKRRLLSKISVLLPEELKKTLNFEEILSNPSILQTKWILPKKNIKKLIEGFYNSPVCRMYEKLLKESLFVLRATKHALNTINLSQKKKPQSFIFDRIKPQKAKKYFIKYLSLQDQWPKILSTKKKLNILKAKQQALHYLSVTQEKIKNSTKKISPSFLDHQHQLLHLAVLFQLDLTEFLQRFLSSKKMILPNFSSNTWQKQYNLEQAKDRKNILEYLKKILPKVALFSKQYNILFQIFLHRKISTKKKKENDFSQSIRQIQKLWTRLQEMDTP